MIKNPEVLIVHIPYEHAGGEDVHAQVLAKAYEEIGFKVSFFPEKRAPESHRFKESFSAIYKDNWPSAIESFCENKQASHLHLHNLFPTLGPGFLKALQHRKIKTMMTVHNHRYYCTNGLALRDGMLCKVCKPSASLVRPIFHNCNQNIKKSIYHGLALSKIRAEDLYAKAVDVFIAPSPYIASELEDIGLPKKQIRVITNPVMPQPGAAANTTSKNSSDVVFAGRLSHEKGIVVLMEVVKKMPEISFTVMGDGPLRPLVEKNAAEYSNLRFLGKQEPAIVVEQIRASKMGILPSLCNEILPTFALECFFNGKPCLVSGVESMEWMAKEPFPGVLAQPGRVDDFIFKIKTTIASKVDIISLSKIQEKLGFPHFCENLKALTNDFLTSRR